MSVNFESRLKNLDDSIYIHGESKQSIEIKSGVWQGETISGGAYIPSSSPHAYQVFKRLELSFINRRSIVESLYFISGVINTEKYLELSKEIETNLEALRKHYNFKSVSLLLVNTEDIEKVKVILFEDIHLCDFYLNREYGISAQAVNSGSIPPQFNGTKIIPQEWHCSQESIIRKYPKPQNLDGSEKIGGVL